MGDHTITGIRSSSQDNAALTVGGAKSIYFPLSRSRAMRGNLQMGDNAIIGIKSSSQQLVVRNLFIYPYLVIKKWKVN